MSPILTASTTVLDFMFAEGNMATYVYKGEDVDDDPNDHIRRIEIPRQMWEDFGKPDPITVTVQPGDQLNSPVPKTEEDKNE